MLPLQRGADVDDGGVAVAAERGPVGGGEGGPVEHDDRVGLVTARGGVGLVGRPGAELLAEQLLQFADGSGDEPERPRAVGLPRVQGVRQPLGPLPVGTPVGRGDHGDAQFVGRVERGQLGEHGAGKGAGPVVGAGRRAAVGCPAFGRPVAGAGFVGAPDQDVGEAAQVDGDGLLGDGAVRVDEAAQGVGAERFEVVDRLGGERGEAHRETLGAARDPYVAEVRV